MRLFTKPYVLFVTSKTYNFLVFKGTTDPTSTDIREDGTQLTSQPSWD